MKKHSTIFISLFVTFFLLISTAEAQNTQWLWAKSAGNNGYDYGRSVVTDQAGNSYMSGDFNTNIDFGNGFSFTSHGSSDIFIVKYDPSGNSTWATSAGGNDADIPYCIAVDKAGNLYVGGYFKSAQLVLGAYTLTNAGGNTFDIFVAKYDPQGNVLWAKSAGGTGDDRGYGVAVDTLGNVYLTGYFVSSTITFGTFPLTNSGSSDLFLVKYAPDGTPLWAHSATGGNSGFEYCYSVAVDYNGNSYICGSFNSNTLTFGGIVLNHHANNDIFVAKYSAAGIPLWADQRGVNSDNAAYSVALDEASNCYVTGSFKSSTLVFGDITLTNSGHMDMFIFKYSPAGVPLWSHSAGGSMEDAGRAVCVDKLGYVYLAGYYKSASIMLGSTTLTNAGTTADLFICEYDSDGEEVLVKGATGPGDDIPWSVAVDTTRNFFLSGYFTSTLNFGNITLTCGGTTDPFIVKSTNIPVGINEKLNSGVAGIYPNPASDYIRIALSGISQISIYDLNGTLRKSVQSDEKTVSVDVRDLASGLYLVRIVSDGKITSGKFVKW